ncbi:ABC transporter permease [Occallatibacter savannae]|uniref:ABC transporter permease n=1 Tax=Occallatibacter savannae TaxID=1002691 RepID=UPI000D6886D4|nr:ABC transporter permease [Occallatibacter savannae]
MTDLWSDIKHALHLFVKSPGFTFAAVAALALGIGANTAIFTVVNAVLLKPLGYPDSDRIMQMMLTGPGGSGPGASIPKFQVWQQQTSVFKDVAAYDFAGPGFNITGDRPELIHGIHVSEAYFRVFGAPVTLGRTFTKEEDSPNGGHVVVLSYGVWQRRFGGDPNVVGKSLSLGSEPYTIVGVLGRDFRTDPEAEIWIPFQFEPNSVNQGHFFLGAAMLKPGVTVAQANAQMKLAYAEFKRKFPDADPKGGFAVQPLRDAIVRGAKTSLLVLLGAVALVLLIACANVANLLLVRATGRKREFAIRAAMGASRTRVIRQLLTESVMLAVTGGALGSALGFLGVRWLLAISPAGLPRVGENGAAVGVDWRVLGFTLLVSCATGVLFGLFPAFSVSRTDLNSTLKESSNRSGTSFGTGKTRAVLVVTEVALALVLLVGAALLIRTFVALRAVNTGFDAHNVLTMEMSLNGDRFGKTTAVAQLSRDGRERLNRIPGVESSTFSCCLPVQGQFGLPFAIIGKPVDPSKGQQGAGWMHASADYYKTFKIPVKRGREFNVSDTASSPHVVIINEAFAKQFFPNENPVGQQIAVAKGMGPPFEEPARTIVGVVGNTHDAGLDQDTPPLMVVPDTQVLDAMTELNAKIVPLRWAVRTHGDPRQLSNAIAEQLRQASGGFPVARIKTMEEIVSNTTSRQTFNMMLLSIFGAIALTLAAIGIYGLMAYSVQQRTQEIGIRMALGADRTTIRKLVVWSGMKLALVGMVLGVGASFGLTRLIASFLFGVKTWDPTAFIAVPSVLCAVAFVAVLLPAMRASKVEPMRALRVE